MVLTWPWELDRDHDGIWLRLINKREELKELVTSKNPDVIQITELLPKQSRDIDIELEFKLSGYQLLYNKNPSRGIITYVKESINVSEHKELNDFGFQECVWCTLNINSTSILLGCIYRSPSSNLECSTINLINMLSSLESFKHDKIIITGDFNYPGINWNNTINTPDVESKFLNCINDLFLQQIVTKPTRHRAGQSSNILDLVFTNDESIIVNLEHVAPLGKSDHDVLLISLNTRKPKVCDINDEKKYNFFKANINGLKHDISSVDWKQLIEMDTDQAVKFFNNVLYSSFEKHIPSTSTKKKKTRPPWSNKKL